MFISVSFQFYVGGMPVRILSYDTLPMTGTEPGNTFRISIVSLFSFVVVGCDLSALGSWATLWPMISAPNGA
jgi:hypothetical protein